MPKPKSQSLVEKRCLIQLLKQKCHRMDKLNNKYLFPRVLEPGKSKIKVVTDLGTGEDPLPG